MDALSEALRSMRITGALFFNAELTAPWGFASPPSSSAHQILAPGTEHLVLFHLVTEGQATVRIDGHDDVTLEAGDIVVLPHGDAHELSNGPVSELIDAATLLPKILAGSLTVERGGGGGVPTKFICGYFGCERYAERLFLAGLPPRSRSTFAATRPARGSRDRFVTWSPSSNQSAPAASRSSRSSAKRCSFRPCADTWMSCRRTERDGSQRRATKLPAEHSPACIESRHAHGHLQNWRKKPACRAQCLRSVLRISWDIRRSPILRSGACNSPHGCSRPPITARFKWRSMSDTSPRPPSIARSNASSSFRRDGIGVKRACKLSAFVPSQAGATYALQDCRTLCAVLVHRHHLVTNAWYGRVT
jgi:cupin